jgi:hypothetical protein
LAQSGHKPGTSATPTDHFADLGNMVSSSLATGALEPLAIREWCREHSRMPGWPLTKGQLEAYPWLRSTRAQSNGRKTTNATAWLIPPWRFCCA